MKRKQTFALLILAGLVGFYAVAHLTGRYTIVSVGYDRSGFPNAYRLDQWTGKVWLIYGLDAYEVKKSPLPSPDPSRKW